jgi:hypothetical protein
MKYKTREYTNILLELMDEGVLSTKQVAEAALSWMSEQDVKQMAFAYEFVTEEDEEEEQDPDEGRDWGMEWYDTSAELM